MCVNGKVTGIHFDGGYAEYTIVPAEAVAAMPEGISDEEAAPLLCAGITVFNAMRNSGTRPGELVAIQGLGGLGHLGVQYARQMGFRTVAIGRSADKEALARKLGAHVYVDSAVADPAKELQKLGGARLILATAPDAKAISAVSGRFVWEWRTLSGWSAAGTDRYQRHADRGRKAADPGMALRIIDRLGRYAEVQRADRRAAHDRDVSAREGGGRLRADDERQGALPRRADHEEVAIETRAGADMLRLLAPAAAYRQS